MVQVKINYITGIGSFLDENNVEWVNLDNENILIKSVNAQHLADILCDFISQIERYN